MLTVGTEPTNIQNCVSIPAMGLFKKKCKTYHCPNLHQNKSGFCDICQATRSASYLRQPVDQTISENTQRPSASQRGYDHSWHQFARTFLESHPVCAVCGKPSQCVDHKAIPAEIMLDMYGRFDLDPSLYQALCFSCNRRKTFQDRIVVEQYFKDKAGLGEKIDPGGGVKTFSTQITLARSGFRYIEENFSEVERG